MRGHNYTCSTYAFDTHPFAVTALPFSASRHHSHLLQDLIRPATHWKLILFTFDRLRIGTLYKNPSKSFDFILMLCSLFSLLSRRGREFVRAVATSSSSLVSPKQSSSLSKQNHSRSSLGRLNFPSGRLNSNRNLGPVLIPSRFQQPMASISSSAPQSVHDFVVKDARGTDVDLSQYKGKVLLIVNVASQCGLTNSNYTEMTELYDKYKGQGLEILAFPCNQFSDQEPGSNDQIVEFACTRFKAEFPIFDKVDVNGDNAAPIYKYLKSSKGGLFGDGVKWNFTKFLVDKDGNVVDRYAPTTSPSGIEKDIKKLLGVS